MTDAIVVPLSSPIQHGEVKLSSLTFRAPEVGDLIAADVIEGETARMAAILASMAGLTYPEFKRVRAGDYSRIVERTAPLWGNAPADGDGSTSQA